MKLTHTFADYDVTVELDMRELEWWIEIGDYSRLLPFMMTSWSETILVGTVPGDEEDRVFIKFRDNGRKVQLAEPPEPVTMPREDWLLVLRRMARLGALYAIEFVEDFNTLDAYRKLPRQVESLWGQR